MKRLGATLALTLLALVVALPAFARDFVQDGAGMFSANTVAQLNQLIGNFNAQTGKQIVVITVPSLGGNTIDAAANQAFSQQNVNGVLIYIAKDDRKDTIVADRAGVQAGWFTPAVLSSIRQSMESQFRAEDFDGGITTAVNGILNVYRQHVNSAPNAGVTHNYPATTTSTLPRSQGIHISMFWWIIIIVLGFLVLRSIMRAASGPRYYGGGPGVGPGAGPGGPGYGGPGYGGPGYGGYGGGPGYYGGGGGGFWSGLLGGLGGAFLGNELFGNRGGNTIIEQQPGNVVPTDSNSGSWGGGDQGGWANDPGQIGGSSSGDWGGGGFGDSGGGGFGDSGGGGGDFGGGGGGDSSSGGW